ncbi:C40 family peptidase [bacterium]|nr:C40 family peptidase [bacterium]
MIFYKNTYESHNEITHVGFYLGNNKMINAT